MTRGQGCLLRLMTLAATVASLSAQSYVPPKGYVPDSETAVEIAEAVLVPVYGKAMIDRERPFKASLRDGVWTVTGTMHCSRCDGGVATVKIVKLDGRVLSMIHGK